MGGSEKMLTVKQAAEKAGISEHTLRYYTDQGLIPGVARDENNKRLFSEESLGYLHLVVCLRGCGMPIGDIKRFMTLNLAGDGTLEDRYQILLEQEARATAQLREAEERLAMLRRKLGHYRERIAQKQ